MFCFLISVYLAWNLCKRWKHSYSYPKWVSSCWNRKLPALSPVPGNGATATGAGGGDKVRSLSNLKDCQVERRYPNTGCFCKTCKCGWGSPRWPCAQAFPEDSSTSFFSRGFLFWRQKPPSWSSGTPVMIMEISFRCLKEGPSCLVTSQDFGINYKECWSLYRLLVCHLRCWIDFNQICLFQAGGDGSLSHVPFSLPFLSS